MSSSTAMSKHEKIFGIGLPKTGTSTLGNALETLGYRLGPRDLKMLRDKEWDRIWAAAESFDCFEDWPWPMIYRELDERYPDARFVLTLRKSPEIWWNSLCVHNRNYGQSESFGAMFKCVGTDSPSDYGIRLYHEHNEAVRSHFAGRPGKLLEVCWEHGHGWTELCDFLGRPAPSQPFPHVNRRWSAFKRWRKNIKALIFGSRRKRREAAP
jgi:hypothetical protein